MTYPTRTDMALFSATEQLIQLAYGEFTPAQAAKHRRQWEGQWLQAVSQGADPTVPFELTFPIDGPSQTPDRAFPLSALELMLTCWPDSLLAWGLDALPLKQPLSEVVFPGLQSLFYTKLRHLSDSDTDAPPLHRGIFKWSEGKPRLNPTHPRIAVGFWEALGGRLFDSEPGASRKGKGLELLDVLEGKGVVWDESAKQALVAQVFKFGAYGAARKIDGVPSLARQLIDRSPSVWWTTDLVENEFSYFDTKGQTMSEQLLSYFDSPTPLKEVLQAKQLEASFPPAKPGHPKPRM